MRLVYALAVAGIAIFVVGCGGTSFKEAANEACAERAETIRAAIEAPEAASDAPLIQQMIDASATELGSLRALEPPPEQQATHRDLLLALDEQLRGSQAILAAAVRGDSTAIQAAISRTGAAAARATSHGRMLGLPDCDWLT